MKKGRLPPLDVRGRLIKKGSRVRIVGVPDLSRMSQPHRGKTESVFRHICGMCKWVDGFDSYGNAEIFFTIRTGPNRGIHSVAIEPFLLRVQPQAARPLHGPQLWRRSRVKRRAK